MCTYVMNITQHKIKTSDNNKPAITANYKFYATRSICEFLSEALVSVIVITSNFCKILKKILPCWQCCINFF